MKTGKPQLMRELNLKQVRELLQADQGLTKPELAKLSGLSVVTVNAIIKQLMARGEVSQLTHPSPTGGRPASRFIYNYDYQLVLAICLYQKVTMDMAEFTICNLAGEIQEQWQVEFQQVAKEEFADLIQVAKSKYPNLQQVAIGLPGVEIAGQIKMSDFMLLKGSYLRSYLKETCGLPVTIENDVNAVLLGYCHTQKIQSETVVALYYPDNYPPGSAVFLHDRIVHGANGIVGEVNLLPLLANWQAVGKNPDVLMMNISQTIVTMMVAYDPHRIVIYGKLLQEELAIRKELLDLFDQVKLPEIICLKSFKEDYLTGVTTLAIQVLKD
ncbi:ROK family transcriptional regulator [uncultured Vagococcus sp.]|uniref:ROK family transcriptional regulator n=1 Tax=uncultured Vagococcus sp. TaxID=189676 RepID=UPI0028D67B3D|nr:ROK family transcriptional regulator [uncultured Vagococcus sp.]